MRDADAVVGVGQAELEEGVGDDGGGVGEAEEGVVGEAGGQAKQGTHEQGLVAKGGERGVAVDNLDESVCKCVSFGSILTVPVFSLCVGRV